LLKDWFSIEFKAGDGSSNAPASSTKNRSKTSVKSETVSKEKPPKKNRKKDQDSEGSSPVDPAMEEKLLVLPCGPSAMGIMSLIVLCGFYVVRENFFLETIFLLNEDYQSLMPYIQVHCVWAAAEAYSAPSIVLTSRSHDGLHVFDDFREAYAWLSHNTEVDDKVLPSWFFLLRH
jgi:dolichyl-diphosphooligosaccharide---protein glycosyltransferase